MKIIMTIKKATNGLNGGGAGISALGRESTDVVLNFIAGLG